jgi:hypothetical protein
MRRPLQVEAILQVWPILRLFCDDSIYLRAAFFRLTVPMCIGSFKDDRANVACFSLLGLARGWFCRAKERSLSHPVTKFSGRGQPEVILRGFRPGTN